MFWIVLEILIWAWNQCWLCWVNHWTILSGALLWSRDVFCPQHSNSMCYCFTLQYFINNPQRLFIAVVEQSSPFVLLHFSPSFNATHLFCPANILPGPLSQCYLRSREDTGFIPNRSIQSALKIFITDLKPDSWSERVPCCLDFSLKESWPLALGDAENK